MREMALPASFAKGFILALAGFLILSWLSSLLPREGIRANIAASLEVMETFKRADSYTECLVLGAAQVKSASAISDVFDFRILAADPCAGLAAAARGEDVPDKSYFRYWSGPVALARMALSLFTFIPAYGFYVALTLAALLLWGYALWRQGVSAPLAAALTLGILWCGGFFFYAGNMAHAPAFFVPALVLALFTLSARWWEGAGKIMLAAMLGALTLAFDMLFGALPFTLSFFLFTFILNQSSAKLRDVISLAAAFLASAFLFFALKIAAVAALFGLDVVLADITGQLGTRMGAALPDGGAVDYFSLIISHLPRAAEKIYGHVMVYYLLLASACAALAYAMLKNPARILPLAALMAVGPFWFLVFLNHSHVHSSFMSRQLFWPLLLGFSALLLVQENKNAKIPSSHNGQIT